MSEELSALRNGNFTSSNNFKLCASLKSGEPSEAFYTYVKEKMFERNLGRSLEMGAHSNSMTWGAFLEPRVFENLSSDYQIIHKETFVHKDHPFLVGTPDFYIEGVKVSELKCFEPKNFASYVSALLTKDTEKIKKEHPKEYWQIISNATILDVKIGEALVYMPYESEMDEIRELANDPTYYEPLGLQAWQVRFIQEKSNKELAVLPNNSKFLNLNVFEFEIPIDDKYFLIDRAVKANNLINK
jgi:YqaJ-like viral recombinase domain